MGGVAMQHILENVFSLVKKFNTNNPFEIADCLNVNVLFHSIGNLKGYYTYDRRSRYIVINCSLAEDMQRIICAHELGHDRLHQHYAKYTPLNDYSLYDMSSKPEREANLFAAELLLTDKEVFDGINSDYSFHVLASTLNVPLELLDFKLQVLKRKGYHFVAPMQARADFLKK